MCAALWGVYKWSAGHHQLTLICMRAAGSDYSVFFRVIL
jgi:hypothetical protein